MSDVDMKDADTGDVLADPELQDVDSEVIPDSEVKENIKNGEENGVDGEDGEGSNEASKGKGKEEDEEFKDPFPMPQPSLLRKDKCLKEFLESMDDYAPIIPDAVTDYYLAKSGFETSDKRIKRLLALATQKFVSDIASDAYQYSRIRSSSSVASAQNPQARARALAAGPGGATGGGGSQANQGKLVLTMEDLGNALAEYGLNVKRPDFYR